MKLIGIRYSSDWLFFFSIVFIVESITIVPSSRVSYLSIKYSSPHSLEGVLQKTTVRMMGTKIMLATTMHENMFEN